MKSLPFMVIFGDLILTGKFCCLNFFLLKNGIDKNFFYQHHLLYNPKKPEGYDAILVLL